MSRSKLSGWLRSLTLLASVGAPCLASAADLPPPPPPPPMPVPVEFGGWYLRGDVGASIYTSPTFYADDKYAKGYHGDGYHDGILGGGGFAGVGVGYQFNEFFRADVTGEYRFTTGLRTSKSGYSEYEYCDGQYGECGTAKESRYGSASGHHSIGVVLANAYVDLGTWYGVTPFIGGGAGVAFHHLAGFNESGFKKTEYTPYDCGCYHPYSYTSNEGGTYKDKDSTSFAWALHAGLAYNVTDAFKVELAYRYLNLGEAKTGPYTSYCGCEGPGMKVKDLEAHDIKIGLRYLIGGIAAPLPPVMADYGPITRKY